MFRQLLHRVVALPWVYDTAQLLAGARAVRRRVAAQTALAQGAARVLRPSGRLILTDAVWADDRRIGKLLWKYDRGSHPRTAEVLRQTIDEHLDIRHWEHFAVWHEYILCVAVPHAGGGGRPRQ